MLQNHCLCIVIVFSATTAIAVTDAFEPITYKNERIQLDNCWTLGRNCGKDAADKWCKIQGYTASKEFFLVKVTPTKTLVGQRCNGPHCTPDWAHALHASEFPSQRAGKAREP